MPLPLGPAISGETFGVAAESGGFTIVAGRTAAGGGATSPQAWVSNDGGNAWARIDLPLPPGAVAGLGTDPGCGNNRTWVVGSAEFPGGDIRAVRWESLDDGQTWMATDLGTVPGSTQGDARALRIYDERDLWFIAGTSFTTAPALDGVAALWVHEMGDDDRTRDRGSHRRHSATCRVRVRWAGSTGVGPRTGGRHGT